MRRFFLTAITVCTAVAGVIGTAAGRQPDKARPSDPFNGLVVDASGRGVKVRVEVVGSDRYIIADSKGRFGLTGIGGDDSLRISYRRRACTVPVASRRSLHVVWNHDDLARNIVREDAAIADMGELYVKRRDRVTPSAGISGDRLRATGKTDLVDALMLCVPGLSYENGELCLRGSSSYNSKSGVLILCDGGEINSVDSINIEDVESVEVVHGANSYGFRGTNGVIMVKTKTGRSR